VILPPEQLVIHARSALTRNGTLVHGLAVQLVQALEEQLAEVARLRDRVVVLEQERFE
jgi:hypothetical protein